MTNQILTASVITENRPDAVMFDSMIFDKLLKEEQRNKLPREIKYYATNIQHEQIKRITDVGLRNELLRIFCDITEVIPSIDKQWFRFEHSNFNNSRFCSPLEQDTLKYLSNGNSKHLEDALILLTAKSIKLILISDDGGTPLKRAKNKGYRVMSFQQFIDTYSTVASN